MARLIVGLLIGLVLGGALTFYFFVGVPQAVIAPGTPIQKPDPNGLPPGTAQIVLRQQFVNDALTTIFTDMKPPSFPLGSATGDCEGRITVQREGSGVQTGVSFDNGKISAPLAFTGSYASMFGCTRFSGWAQSNFEMRFDQQSQTVFGQINVETVNLDGVNPVVSALVTPLVQSTLNTRVNPVRIIDGRQIAIDLPIVAAEGNLQSAVKDVRAEVKDQALNLYVVYDSNGGPLTIASPQR
ncbi:MAG TPA: hypothetical protein VJV05_14245 [Pyrinomonadaceae bacterium]|nr:hypothetical protein [Pyrinomonadaceae bacterium]